MIERRIPLTMLEIIHSIREQYISCGEDEVYADSGWCVYSASEKPGLRTECYVDEYPDITDDDEEILPPFALEHRLGFVFRDEMVQDVVISCLCQKEDALPEEIMNALDYYNQNDCFLKLE